MHRLALFALLFASSLGVFGCNSCSKNDEPKTTELKPIGSGMAGVATAPNPECAKLCRAVGKCAFQDGKCYASSDRDCRVSFGCRTAGFCTVHEEKCAAMTDQDCAGSEICKMGNKCFARDGRCQEPVSSPTP